MNTIIAIASALSRQDDTASKLISMTIMYTKPLQEVVCDEIDKVNNQYLKQVEFKKLLNKEINNIFKCAKEFVNINIKNIKLTCIPRHPLGIHWWNFTKFYKLDKNEEITDTFKLKQVKIDFNKLHANDEFELKLYNLAINTLNDFIIESMNVRKYNKPGEYKYRDYNINYDSVSYNLCYKWHIYQ